MKSRLLTPNRLHKTVPTCADIARLYLIVGLVFGFLGYQLVRINYFGANPFFTPGVGMLLAAGILVSYWVMEQIIQWMNRAGRSSVDGRSFVSYDVLMGREPLSTEVPQMWSEILGPDAVEKRKKEAAARKLRAIASPAQWEGDPTEDDRR